MKKIDLYKHIENIFKEEIKKGYKSEYDCDDFINKLYDLQNNPDFEENFQNGDYDYIFNKGYSYYIDNVENIMDLFKEQSINCIDYGDWYSIKSFMENVETCNEYCLVDESEARIVKWKDSYENWLDEVLEDTQFLIKRTFKRKRNVIMGSSYNRSIFQQFKWIIF